MASCCGNGYLLSSLLAQALISLAEYLLHTPCELSLLCSWDGSKSRYVNLNQNLRISRIWSWEFVSISPVELTLGFGFHPQLRILSYHEENIAIKILLNLIYLTLYRVPLTPISKRPEHIPALYLDCKSFIVICYNYLFIVFCQAWPAFEPNNVLFNHERFRLIHCLCVFQP